MAEFPIPYHHSIPEFNLPSKVQLSGIVKEGANRFEVDLKSKEGEFLLHFNPRFNEDCVVRSCTKNGGQWQSEERDGGMPFAQGKPFNIELMIDENAIMCSVNGSPFCQFAVRDDLSQIGSLDVDGDIQLVSLSVISLGGGNSRPMPTEAGGKGPRETNEDDGITASVTRPEPHPQEPEPQPQPPHQPQPTPQHVPVTGPQGKLPLPYQGPLEELAATNRMRIVATPHPGAQRFTVNWKSKEGETLFHFNPHFDQNCVVRNATVNREYQAEEREGGPCPFQPGKQFALDFLLHGSTIRCFVDGIEFCRFEARSDLHQVAILDIHGDIALEQVLIA